jgi:hypothetical protein
MSDKSSATRVSQGDIDSGAAVESTIVCPFCCLHCDDLHMDDHDGIDVDCGLARRQFRSATGHPPPRIGRSIADAAAVVRHVKERIRGVCPWVMTGAVSLRNAKQLDVLQAAGKIRWILDDAAANQSMRRAISREGMIAASLGDVGRHADFVWTLGNQDDLPLPRLKHIAKPVTTGAVTMHWPDGIRAGQLGDLLHSLRFTTEPSMPPLAEVYRSILGSKYFAVVWVDDAFHAVEADAATCLLLNLVAMLNDPKRDPTRRAVLVPIDPCQTARSVSAWRSNQAPMGLTKRGMPRDPLIRVGAVQHWPIPALVQLGGEDPGEALANCYLPAAMPGVHESDAAIRGDGAVTLPLQKIGDTDVPNIPRWFEMLLDSKF